MACGAILPRRGWGAPVPKPAAARALRPRSNQKSTIGDQRAGTSDQGPKIRGQNVAGFASRREAPGGFEQSGLRRPPRGDSREYGRDSHVPIENRQTNLPISHATPCNSNAMLWNSHALLMISHSLLRNRKQQTSVPHTKFRKSIALPKKSNTIRKSSWKVLKNPSAMPRNSHTLLIDSLAMLMNSRAMPCDAHEQAKVLNREFIVSHRARQGILAAGAGWKGGVTLLQWRAAFFQ